ncbi:MAG: hypothetical protein KBB94_05195 [Legionellaceae bacterium]|nr:hypothetical protein [Legionellaceae bacterium]MBP9775208.1 hypothetical protein [Legionellaceae bacterium]
MSKFYQLLALLSSVVVIWILYRTIRAQPEQFSRENLSKSFSTMAILALLLIGFVAFLVFMVRQ